jgi:hypothetical protein
LTAPRRRLLERERRARPSAPIDQSNLPGLWALPEHPAPWRIVTTQKPVDRLGPRLPSVPCRTARFDLPGAARSQSWRRLVPTMSSPTVLAQAARETEFRRQRLSGRLRPRLRQNRRNLVRRPPRPPLSLGSVATFASEGNCAGFSGLICLSFARIRLRTGVLPSTKPPPFRRVAQ